MAQFASNLEKKVHRKEATHNGNKVWLFSGECFRKIIFSGLGSCLPIQILIFPHAENKWQILSNDPQIGPHYKILWHKAKIKVGKHPVPNNQISMHIFGQKLNKMKMKGNIYEAYPTL